MPQSELDHLVVTAPGLSAGEEYVERILGVRPRPGGEHEQMGTHNSLLRLRESAYLEVIAINPDAPNPMRPRWFGLDDLLHVATPRLTTWVARCDDIYAAVDASPVPLGTVLPMSRGNLEWLITVPEDGGLIMDGIVPTLIQWTRGGHPATHLGSSGCVIVQLQLAHPQPERANALLAALGVEVLPFVPRVKQSSQPRLEARLWTSNGERILA